MHHVERLPSLAEAGQEDGEGDAEVRHVLTLSSRDGVTVTVIITPRTSGAGCSGRTDQLLQCKSSTAATTPAAASNSSPQHHCPHVRNSWSASRNVLKERPIKVPNQQNATFYRTREAQFVWVERNMFATALALKR